MVAAKQLGVMVLGALILTPLTVVVGRRGGGSGESDRILRATVLLLRGVAVVGVLLSVAVWALSGWPAVELAVFVAGGLAVELQRRVNFIVNRVRHDLIGGAVMLIGCLAGPILLAAAGALTLTRAALVVGALQVGWAVVCGWRYWAAFPRTRETRALLDLWRVGRWGLASNVAGYLYAYLGLFLTLSLIGAAGVAVLELGRQLIMPVQVLLLGTANAWHPTLARSAQNDPPRRFVREVWRFTRLQSVAGGGLLVVLLIAGPSLLPLLVPGKEAVYASSPEVAWILGGAMMCQLVWQHASFGIIALGKPEYGFLTRLITVAGLAPIGYVLTDRFAVQGAAWTVLLGEAVVLVLSVALFQRAAGVRRTDLLRTERAVEGAGSP
jgi:O-antigen/teichoic acid export membrane protein